MFDKMSGGDVNSMLLSRLASNATHFFRVSRFYIELRLGECAQGELPALTMCSPRTTTWVRGCGHSSSCRTHESEARLLNVFSILDIGNRDSALRLNLQRHPVTTNFRMADTTNLWIVGSYGSLSIPSTNGLDV